MSQSKPGPDPGLQIPHLSIPIALKSVTEAEARRGRLREFQAHLLERMQAARSGANSSNNQLGLLIGNQRWLLSLDEAGEIVAASGITKVPLTQDWYLGLTNIRGTLISVIDFARFQGQPKTVVDKDTRIVAFSNALAFYSALLVDRVLGLRNVEEMVLQPGLLAADYPVGAEHTAAETGETVARTAPAQYLDSESQLWTELKLTQVVSDPRFLHIGL